MDRYLVKSLQGISHNFARNIVSGYTITILGNFAQLCIRHTLRGLASVVCQILRLLGLIPSVFVKSAKRRYSG